MNLIGLFWYANLITLLVLGEKQAETAADQHVRCLYELCECVFGSMFAHSTPCNPKHTCTHPQEATSGAVIKTEK